MRLKDIILKEHSIGQRDAVVAWVGSAQRRFDQLFNLMRGTNTV